MGTQDTNHNTDEDGNQRDSPVSVTGGDGHTPETAHLGEYDVVIPEPERATTEEKRTANRNVLFVALFAAIGGMLYGYDTGIISGALPRMAAQWGISGSESKREIVTAAILLGAVLGALGGGALSKRLGRRKTVLIIAIVFAIGVILCSIAQSWWEMAIFRLFLGLAVGACSQITPTYIAELAPPHKRGQMVTFFNIAIGVGIFLANLVAFALRPADGSESSLANDHWRWMIGVAVLPAIVLAVAMLRLPETPRWLIDHGMIGKARVVLRQMRPTKPEAVDEAIQIYKISQMEQEAAKAGWSNLKKPWLRPALIGGLGIAAFTQLSGLEMMIYYSGTFLKDDAKFSPFLVAVSGVGIATVYLIFTAVGERLVDVVGRRRLMLFLIPGATLFLFLFGLLFTLQPHDTNKTLTLVFMLVYMACNAAGLQAVGWLLGSELYPLSIRDKATSLHAVALWGSNLLLTVTALSTIKAIGFGQAMLCYAFLNLLSFFFVYFVIPETKGHSLEDIEQSLRDGTFLPLKGNISSHVNEHSDEWNASQHTG